MNAYKQFARAKGCYLEADYDVLPCQCGTAMYVEGIECYPVANGIAVKTYYNTLVLVDIIGRNGEFIDQFCED